jgi:tetratricopeptide (TPR) repeat protein
LDLVSAQNPDDQSTYLRAVFKAALIILTKKYPRLGQLLVQCSQSSGGFSEDAVQRLYWLNFAGDISATQAAQQLFTLGLLTYDSHEERYYIHPMVRRYLRAIGSDILDFSRQDQHAFDHARYYLTLAQRYSRTSPTQWGTLDSDWGNIRKAFDFLTDSLEKALSLSVEQILATIDTSGLPALPTGIDETLILIRDYALALSTYVIWRHPPEARRWMTVGIIASRGLADRRAEALIGVALAILAYFHHDYLMAQRWYRHSLPFFKEFHEYPRVVQITKNLGTVFRAINNLDEAFKMYEEALALATEHDFQADQSEIQLLIGSLYYHQKEYQAAIDHYLQALDIDRERRNEAWQAVHYNNLGLAMEASGKYERAIEYYKQAIDLHKRVDNKRGLSMTCGNLGAAYYQLGRLDEALKWYMQDMKIRDSIGNWLDKAAILHNMGHVALEMDDLDPAASYFTQSRDIYREFGQNELADEEQVLVDTVQDRRTIFG